LDPVCEEPFLVRSADCVSLDGPQCKLGFHRQEDKCILNAGPTCGPPDSGLVVHSNKDGKAICVSTKPPECPVGSKAVDSNCQITEDPKCPEGFKVQGGSCIWAGTLCPEGGEFTTFDDERAPVCRTVEDPTCVAGELEGTRCVTKELPCPADFELKDGQCTRSTPIECATGTKPFLLPPSDSFRDRNRPPSAVCCPSIPDMTVDRDGRCSVPATTGACPEGMRTDPDNRNKCIRAPDEADCPRGKLDPITLLCTEVTDAKCTIGIPDEKTAKCNLGKPSGESLGPDFKFDEETNKCSSFREPRCPDRSSLLGGQCISETDSTCPEGTEHTADFKHCIFQAPPNCGTLSHYDASLQLCVADNKPVCPADIADVHLDGLACVSPSKPACPPDSDTTYDPNTNACVTTKLPTCPVGFHVSLATSKCVSDRPPARLQGHLPPLQRQVHLGRETCLPDRTAVALGPGTARLCQRHAAVQGRHPHQGRQMRQHGPAGVPSPQDAP